jgi:EMC6
MCISRFNTTATASCLQMSGLLLVKAGFNMEKYFRGNGNWMLVSGIASQTELLTFILFWTLANNVIYLF